MKSDISSAGVSTCCEQQNSDDDADDECNRVLVGESAAGPQSIRWTAGGMHTRRLLLRLMHRRTSGLFRNRRRSLWT